MQRKYDDFDSGFVAIQYTIPFILQLTREMLTHCRQASGQTSHPHYVLLAIQTSDYKLKWTEQVCTMYPYVRNAISTLGGTMDGLYDHIIQAFLFTEELCEPPPVLSDYKRAVSILTARLGQYFCVLRFTSSGGTAASCELACEAFIGASTNDNVWHVHNEARESRSVKTSDEAVSMPFAPGPIHVPRVAGDQDYAVNVPCAHVTRCIDQSPVVGSGDLPPTPAPITPRAKRAAEPPAEHSVTLPTRSSPPHSEAHSLSDTGIPDIPGSLVFAGYTKGIQPPVKLPAHAVSGSPHAVVATSAHFTRGAGNIQSVTPPPHKTAHAMRQAIQPGHLSRVVSASPATATRADSDKVSSPNLTSEADGKYGSITKPSRKPPPPIPKRPNTMGFNSRVNTAPPGGFSSPDTTVLVGMSAGTTKMQWDNSFAVGDRYESPSRTQLPSPTPWPEWSGGTYFNTRPPVASELPSRLGGDTFSMLTPATSPPAPIMATTAPVDTIVYSPLERLLAAIYK